MNTIYAFSRSNSIITLILVVCILGCSGNAGEMNTEESIKDFNLTIVIKKGFEGVLRADCNSSAIAISGGCHCGSVGDKLFGSQIINKGIDGGVVEGFLCGCYPASLDSTEEVTTKVVCLNYSNQEVYVPKIAENSPDPEGTPENRFRKMKRRYMSEQWGKK